MKLSDVLVIYFTNIILRATSTYVPFVLVHNDDHSSLFLLAGFLTFLLLSLRKRKPVTATTIKTSTTSTASTTSTTAVPPKSCSVGYTLYGGPGKNFCYRLSSDFKTWNDAQTACKMEGTDLTSLDDASLEPFLKDVSQQFPENVTITSMFPRGVWLGARANDAKVATYVNGQTIPSNSPLWMSGEPDEPGNCILSLFIGVRTPILDFRCNDRLKYVCQKL